MITTVADLLQSLLEKEKTILERQPELNHAPMLGDMYEGLAREILRKSIFEGLGLKIVEGKARDCEGQLSGQLDCMVVVGEGEQLPYTDHFIYDLPQVIAVLEVKKTLYGNDLADSFLHLGAVKEAKFRPDAKRINLVRDAWRTLQRRPLPNGEEIAKLSDEENMIRSVLFREAHEPLRFVLGYDGYASEFQLRRGFIRFLSEAAQTGQRPGFGIECFPNQIICGQASLLKTSGMPFGSAIPRSGYWPFFASRGKAPLHLLLEFLWTRLAYMFQLSPELFGEDLTSETVAPLLDAKWRPGGWEYRYTELTKEQLQSGPASTDWEPAEVSTAEFVVLNKLCQGEPVKLDDPGFVEFLKKENVSVEEFAGNLNKKYLAYQRTNKLILLTDECACVTLPDGRLIAGENKTGRLTRWVARYMEKRRTPTG